uniref:NADH-ubiquinone oxidoreductase chain 4L n=1 Tax=Chrysochroa fulgidissima TaxID=543396 RepID=C5H686_9COLE|nr:NADH dehydrogenase subunit 4L [Chrysochroa fulgidissima]ACF04028.1 NADH dehydrogenase subunit 4L [Chrysochroa fulgidissima]
MLNWLLVLGLFIFFSGGFVFCSKRKHLLMMLLSLEFIVLSLYFLIIIFLSLFDFEFFFSMLFLTMSVCEGALGLSVLVSVIRTHGGDYFNSLNCLW